MGGHGSVTLMRARGTVLSALRFVTVISQLPPLLFAVVSHPSLALRI